ncbi:MAG: hypothetical protein HS113_14200 [Verrucomicrobiales bacterium]|nr:hypothetical protein [Verrucomicrobiales bacterium]
MRKKVAQFKSSLKATCAHAACSEVTRGPPRVRLMNTDCSMAQMVSSRSSHVTGNGAEAWGTDKSAAAECGRWMYKLTRKLVSA